ncbi:MAG: hypothetical protein [Caudoviricetes sp.]|nr:MAG: hypothetical protein [Caudoviricetes sp.]
MTKEEKIKQEYNKISQKLPNDILEYALENNGFISKDTFISFLGYTEWGKSESKRIKTYLHCRLGSLKGLETNNGWIKIQSEGDLPKENAKNYWTITENDKNIKERWFNKFFNEYEGEGKVTHYQPIEKPKSPLY